MFHATTDNGEGQLNSTISGVDTTIVLKSGEGARFPQPITASATSTGDTNNLNSTGIQAAGVQVGDIIHNLTDGSLAFVFSVDTNAVVTTDLQGGTDNLWQSGDEWCVRPFVVAINERDSEFANINSSEQVLIKDRSTDTLTAHQRGYNSTSATTWAADDYVSLFVFSDHVDKLQEQVALNGNKIYNLETTKADTTYVDAALAARSWKSAVVAASTANVALSTDVENGDTLDGVTLATGDRILLKDQTTASENGIYVVAASGAPTRATDFDETSEVESAIVPVQQGTANADLSWICTSDNPTIGVDNLDFTQFNSSTTIASEAEAEAATNNTKMMTPLRTGQAIDALRPFGGDSNDGNVDGTTNITITGSNNTYIQKRYGSWAAASGGTKTCTVTPTGCVVHIRIDGDADFTDWTFDFDGKGIPGGAGGTGATVSPGPGTANGNNGSVPSKTGAGIRMGFPEAGQGGESNSTSEGAGGSGGAGGGSVSEHGVSSAKATDDGGSLGGEAAQAYDGLLFDLSSANGFHMYPCAPGMGGAGGASGGMGYGGSSGPFTTDAGGDGGDGGGCLIIEVHGNVTFSTTSFSLDGTNGSAPTTNTPNGAYGGAGGGGGGAGGTLLILATGTVTGSPTVSVTGGTGGTFSSGGGGGTNGTAGGDGADGDYAILTNYSFA